MVQILRLRARYALGFAVTAGLAVAALPLIAKVKAKFSHTSPAFTVSASGHRKLVGTPPALMADDSAPGSHANYNDYAAVANVNGYGHGATLVGTGYASLKDTGNGSSLSGSEAGNAEHTLSGNLRDNGTISVGATGQVFAALNHGDTAGYSGGSSIGGSGTGIASTVVDMTDSDLANSGDPSQGVDSSNSSQAADGIYGDPTAAAGSGSQEISSVSDRQLRSGADSATVTTDDSANVIVTNTRGSGGASVSDSYGASRDAGEFTSYGADDATNGSSSGGGLLNSADGSGGLTSSAGNGSTGGLLAGSNGSNTGSGSGGGLLAVNTGGSAGSGPTFGNSGGGNGGTILGGAAGNAPGRAGSGDKQEHVDNGDLYNGPGGQPTSSPSGDPLGATAAPEPGVVVTALSLIGMTGLGLVRGRRRSRKA